ncbi:MAG: hypothetical protein V1676_00400 [Candidatus Diapherotrites archaeon]
MDSAGFNKEIDALKKAESRKESALKSAGERAEKALQDAKVEAAHLRLKKGEDARKTKEELIKEGLRATEQKKSKIIEKARAGLNFEKAALGKDDTRKILKIITG